ncbi:class A beta-lactamase-related serine hydrolase [Streptomyces tricolor]|nr:class A beta-lactamase-related serine hydrolase [Streptomyces tricolor]
MHGSFLARNLDTGEQLGFDIDESTPLASVVKVPLALVVLDLIEQGELDPAAPGHGGSRHQQRRPHRPGRFPVSGHRGRRRPAPADAVGERQRRRDALLDLVPVADVDRAAARLGMRRDPDAAPDEPPVRVRRRDRRQRLPWRWSWPSGDERAGRHTIETLDPAHANAGSAAALVGLLRRVWCDEIAGPRATAELRRLMGLQVFTQRLASDLRTDSLRWSGKTGTFLHLRHEIGVLEADSGDRVAMAALTCADRSAGLARGHRSRDRGRGAGGVRGAAGVGGVRLRRRGMTLVRRLRVRGACSRPRGGAA